MRSPSVPRSILTAALLTCLVASLLASPAAGGHGAGSPVPTVPPEQAQRLVDAGEPVVFIDLRPAESYLRGHVRGARSVPLAELTWRLGEVPRAGRVLLYGDSDYETTEAYIVLRDRDYRNVTVLGGGFAAWRSRGLPIEPAR